jgi:hypothetical protein
MAFNCRYLPDKRPASTVYQVFLRIQDNMGKNVLYQLWISDRRKPSAALAWQLVQSCVLYGEFSAYGKDPTRLNSNLLCSS